MIYLVTYWDFDDGFLPHCAFPREEEAKEYVHLKNKAIEKQGRKYDSFLDKKYGYEAVTFYQNIKEAEDDLP